jgi:DinB superfamily
MNQTERATILRLLSESSAALESAVNGVSPADATRKLPESEWSVQEITEHVAISEEQMYYGLTERFRPIPEAPPDEPKEVRIRESILNRNEKRVSPEPSRPSGRFGSLAEALAHFRACRARTIHYVEQGRDNLRARSVKHPLAGIVTGYEYLLILASHPLRHAAQIREVRAALGF